MKLRFLVLLLSGVSLAACAHPPAPEKSTPPAAVTTPHPALTEQVLYQVLLGEIAGQRGDLTLAAEAYTDLAFKTRDRRIARRATEIVLLGRQPTQAKALVELWLSLEPNAPRALQTLVSILVGGNGHLADAKPYIEVLLRQDAQRSGEVFARLHTLLYRHKDKRAVLDLVTELAAAYPLLPEAKLAVAQAAWDAGQRAVGLRALDEALALRPGWAAAALFRGQLLQADGDAVLIEYWEGFLAEHPRAGEVRSALARTQARAGRLAAARANFERLVADAPENSEYEVAIGLLTLQIGDLDAADRHFRQALDKGFRESGQVKLYLGQVEEARKRDEAALRWYREIGGGDHYFAGQLRAARLLGRLDRLAEARELLAALVSDDPEQQVEIAQTEAQLLRDAHRHEAAFDSLSAALVRQPDAAALLYDRAMVAEKLDRLAVLEADLRRLIALQPNHAHAYNALGYTLADRTNRTGEAIELIGKALTLAPEDPFILDSMGWALFRANRLDESVTFLRRAYANRADPEIAAHLGEALWAKGERTEAGRVWQGALAAHPDNEVLKETVSRLRP